jgi:hypothetical protein
MCITDEGHRRVLLSTRNRQSRAVRQGAAWPTERSSGRLVVRWVVSRWQVPHRRRAGHRRRASQAPSAGPRFGIQRAGGWSWCPGCCPDVCRAEVALSAYSAASTCPVSGALSAYVVSTRRLSDVRVLGVRCPASVSARPVSAVSAPVTSWRASGRRAAHGQRGPGLAVLPYPRTADHRPEPEWLLVWPVWRGVGCVAQGGGGDYAAWSSWEARVESAGL